MLFSLNSVGFYYKGMHPAHVWPQKSFEKF